GPNGLALGDADGDGQPDLAVAENSSNQVSVFLREPSAVAVRGGPVPHAGIFLSPNHPNPFGGASTTIDYVGTPGQAAQLRILDVRGHLVRTLVRAVATGERQTVVWDGKDER